MHSLVHRYELVATNTIPGIYSRVLPLEAGEVRAKAGGDGIP